MNRALGWIITGLLLTNSALTADRGVEVIRAADKLGGNRHALIIGINDYTDPKIPDLKYAEVDAQSLYKTLTDPQVGGFTPENTTLLLGKQATTRAIKKALSDLRGTGANDLVVVYFSGHGAKQRGETCWVTQDAELNYLADTALSNDQIEKYLNAIPSQRFVVLLDACYAADTVINQRSVLNVESLARAFDGAGRVTIASAGGGQESIEADDLKQGVFTHFLVQGLRGAADQPPSGNLDGVQTLSELWSYLSDKVTQEARKRQGIQVPTKHSRAETQTDKFLLTINAPYLAKLAREQQAAQTQVKARVDALKKLLADDKINADQFTEGRRVLEALEQDLNETDRQRRTIYTDLTEGRLLPNYLQAALDKVETPAEREARMGREAEQRAQRDRSARISALLATAKANDNKENGKTALAALDELLKLDSGHAEAQRLRATIAAYYKVIATQRETQMAREAEQRAQRDRSAQRISLFDGETLKGWTVLTCEAVVDNGEILLKDGNGLVQTARKYGDFIFECDWKAVNKEKYDSGIYFRYDEVPSGRPWPKRYQVSMRQDDEGNVGGLQGAMSTGLIKPGEWNHFRLTVCGTQTEFEINGKLAWKADGLEGPKESYISLQAQVPNGGQFRFRNVFITELK